MIGDFQPRHLELKKDSALIVHWTDGRVSVYPIAYLRRMSPSADAKAIREEMERNPLTVLPSSTAAGPLTATGAELVGNYAIRIVFSDGHETGLYSWVYLREIDPETVRAQKAQKEQQKSQQTGGASGSAQSGNAQ